MKQSLWLYLLIVLASALVAFLAVPSVMAAVIPGGATVSPGTNQTAPIPNASSQPALAGDVSSIDLTGLTITKSWQGYYGNVSGTVELANNAGNVFYNWSDTNPTGQVYASTSGALNWTSVQCFNFSASGGGVATDTGETPGLTNTGGLNLTQLESQFNMNFTAPDNVNSTFVYVGNHTTFYTANLNFSSNECQSTQMFDSANVSQAGFFQETILYDPTTGSPQNTSLGSPIWTALLNQNIYGFDNKTHDFEMLVPEDGHGTNTAPTTYYFYLEIQ